MISTMGTRVHILGASGSGTSTLGRALARCLGAAHLDTDDFYWAPSDVPFTVKRSVEERLELLGQSIGERERWVLSGSLCSWGDPLIPLFTHVVFLYVPWDVRRIRLTNRERLRYGEDALMPGGRMHEVSRAFLDWASRYDHAGLEQRSYATHDSWLGRLPDSCDVLRVEEETEIQSLTERVQHWLSSET